MALAPKIVQVMLLFKHARHIETTGDIGDLAQHSQHTQSMHAECKAYL